MNKSKHKKILKNIIMFFMFFIWQIIPIIFLNILGINPSNFNIIQKNLYLILSYLSYLIIVILIYYKELMIDFKKYKENFKKIFMKYLPVYILGIILMGMTNIIVSKITNMNISSNETSIREYIKLFPIYMSFSTVIYAPIIEEITFRKIIKNIVDNKYLFIIISGILFGIVHLNTNPSINDYLMILPYIVMGIDFAYIYNKTDTIFSTIIFHALHNLILLIIQLIGG